MATFFWYGTDSDNWSDPVNWALNAENATTAPGPGDLAEINLAGAIVDGDNSPTVDELYVVQAAQLLGNITADDAYFGAAGGEVTLTGGLATNTFFEVYNDSLTVASHGVLLTGGPSDVAGVEIDRNGALTISGGEFHDNSDGALIGYDDEGSLIADDAATVVMKASEATDVVMTIGVDDNATGAVSVSGTGSSFLVDTGVVYVGYAGKGGFFVDDDAQVALDDGVSLGVVAGSYGEIDVDDDATKLSIADDFVVGYSGDGVVNVGAGASLDVEGDKSSLALGSEKGSNGAVVDQGTMTVAGDVVVGYDGAGTLTVSDGGKFTTDGETTTIAEQSGSSGTIKVSGDGSEIELQGLVIGGTPTEAGGAATLTATSGGVVGIDDAVLMWGGVIDVDSESAVGVGQDFASASPGLNVASDGFVVGYGTITGDVDNEGVIAAADDTLTLDDSIGGGGQLQIESGATLKLESDVGQQQTVYFDPTTDANGGTLDLIGEGSGATFSSQFQASVSGFGANSSDTIDVAGSGGEGDGVYWNQAGTGESPYGDMVVKDNDGNVLESLTLEGDYVQSGFQLTPDGSIDQITYVACYARGTHMLTDRGEVAIEALRTGDLLVTASGALRPVRWTGRRRLDLSRHANPDAVMPVRIAPHALRENGPQRELWLSPGHNIVSEGALMPVSALVNGRSVVQIRCDRVEYWHVELDAHDVVFAEGLPAETYLDTGNRTAFENGGAFVEAHPDFQPRHWADTCLPLALDGPAVALTRARLLTRLFDQGHETTQDADAHIVCDGRRIEPMRLSSKRLAFALPEGGRDIALRSRVFVPAHMTVESQDRRELGLCVARLDIDGEHVRLDGGALDGAGWHAAEIAGGRFAHRWTRGAVSMPKGARILLLDLAQSGRYWREAEESRLASLA